MIIADTGFWVALGNPRDDDPPLHKSAPELTKENAMICLLCRYGETAPGLVTVNLTRGGTVVVVKGVPAEVCQNCGEYDLDSATAERLYQQAEAAVARRAELEVLRYAA